eukprot:14069925-Alexandrium_andersonii.AAC.1
MRVDEAEVAAHASGAAAWLHPCSFVGADRHFLGHQPLPLHLPGISVALRYVLMHQLGQLSAVDHALDRWLVAGMAGGRHDLREQMFQAHVCCLSALRETIQQLEDGRLLQIAEAGLEESLADLAFLLVRVAGVDQAHQCPRVFPEATLDRQPQLRADAQHCSLDPRDEVMAWDRIEVVEQAGQGDPRRPIEFHRTEELLLGSLQGSSAIVGELYQRLSVRLLVQVLQALGELVDRSSHEGSNGKGDRRIAVTHHLQARFLLARVVHCPIAQVISNIGNLVRVGAGVQVHAEDSARQDDRLKRVPLVLGALAAKTVEPCIAQRSNGLLHCNGPTRLVASSATATSGAEVREGAGAEVPVAHLLQLTGDAQQLLFVVRCPTLPASDLQRAKQAEIQQACCVTCVAGRWRCVFEHLKPLVDKRSQCPEEGIEVASVAKHVGCCVKAGDKVVRESMGHDVMDCVAAARHGEQQDVSATSSAFVHFNVVSCSSLTVFALGSKVAARMVASERKHNEV